MCEFPQRKSGKKINSLLPGFDDVDEKLLRQLPVDMSHKMSLFFKYFFPIPKQTIIEALSSMRLPTVEPGSRLKLIEAKLRFSFYFHFYF